MKVLNRLQITSSLEFSDILNITNSPVGKMAKVSLSLKSNVLKKDVNQKKEQKVFEDDRYYCWFPNDYVRNFEIKSLKKVRAEAWIFKVSDHIVYVEFLNPKFTVDYSKGKFTVTSSSMNLYEEYDYRDTSLLMANVKCNFKFEYNAPRGYKPPEDKKGEVEELNITSPKTPTSDSVKNLFLQAIKEKGYKPDTSDIVYYMNKNELDVSLSFIRKERFVRNFSGEFSVENGDYGGEYGGSSRNNDDAYTIGEMMSSILSAFKKLFLKEYPTEKLPNVSYKVKEQYN